MDVFGLTNKPQSNWVFYSNGISDSWQTWNKPPNCKFVSFFLIGGGAGGSSGVSGVTINRAGGGGGGSSSTTRAIFPAIILPNTLYIQVGLGGSGGVGSGASGYGNDGSLSYVSVEPSSSNSTDVLLASGAVPANGSVTLGGAGAAGTIFSQTTALPSYLGLVLSNSGGNGGAAGISVGVSLSPSIITCGGAGGGGSSSTNSNFAGGSIGATILTPLITNGLAGSSLEAGSGIFTYLPSTDTSSNTLPMIFLGGAGGGGNGTGTGGRGGNGSYGCGGGGGGAGITTGSGGRGGDGLVIITAF